MGRFSQLAKQKGGYIVSMAPAGNLCCNCGLFSSLYAVDISLRMNTSHFYYAYTLLNHACSDYVLFFYIISIFSLTFAESYLDPTHHTFDRSLLHNYREWEPIVPNFNYHGRNTYAYLLDKYGYYTEETDTALDTAATAVSANKKLRTFDFVTIQLYEGYSHAEYNTTQLGQSPADYVTHWVTKVLAGWDIDYSVDTELKYPYVNKLTLDRTELVVGCANGWAGDGKFFLLFPDQVSALLK